MLKDVFSLTFSSLIGQLINLAVLILVARMVSTTEYGAYTVCLTLVGYVVVVASAKYHHAIFAGSKSDAEILTVGSQIFSLILSVFVLVVLFILRTTGMWTDVPLSYFPLIAIAGYLSGMSLFFYYFALKEGRLKQIIYSRVFPPIVGGVVMLSLAYLGLGVFGLLLGYIVSLIVMCVFLGAPKALNVKFSDIKKTLIKHKKFPVMLLPAGVVETFNASFLLLAASQIFGLEISAALGLYYRIVVSPQGMLTSAIGDIFKKKISSQENKIEAKKFFLEVLSILVLGAAAGSLVIWIFSYYGLTLVLGEKWAYAAPFFRGMIPLFFASFVVSPVSTVLYIYNGQRYDLYLQVLAAVGFVVTYVFFNQDIASFLVAFIAVSLLKYIFELYCSFVCLREKNEAS